MARVNSILVKNKSEAQREMIKWQRRGYSIDHKSSSEILLSRAASGPAWWLCILTIPLFGIGIILSLVKLLFMRGAGSVTINIEERLD